MTNHLIIQRQSITVNRLERRQLDGREYAVAPATIIVAGVLNGELVPAEELADFAERWNGRPLPLRHPKDAAGNYIIANDPRVVEESVLGAFYNAQFAGDRVRGEMWLDVAKIERLGGDAADVLARLDGGETVEVSTGYFALQVDDERGSFNGQAYSAIQRNLVPDHIALLPDEVGACSVAQGCGAGRWNALQDDIRTGVMLAFYLRDADAQAMALTSVPDGVEALPANELHITLAYLGKIDELQIEEAQLLEMASWIARNMVVQLVEVHGYGRFLNAEQNDGMEPVFAICQAETLYCFRKQLVEYLEGMESAPERYHGYLPHITLAYAPPGVEVPLQLERRTLVFDALAVSWGDRTVTFPLQGEIREDIVMNKQEKDQARVKPKAAKVVANEEGSVAAEGEAGTLEVVAEIEVTDEQSASDVAAMAGLLAEFGGVDALRDALTAIKANSQGQKAAIVGRIVANRANAFSQTELEALPLDTLIKLDRTLTPANYSGAGALAINTAAGSEWRGYEAPKLN